MSPLDPPLNRPSPPARHRPTGPSATAGRRRGRRGLSTVAAEEGLDLAVDPAAVHLERPARREHGDWSTNIAMVTAKRAGTNPRALATSLVEVLEPSTARPRRRGGDRRPRVHQLPTRRRLAPRRAGRPCSTEGEDGYARPDVGHGERVQVEFISANPTGPIHVGNGWWGSYGDALARVLARAGYQVSREYYVNDTGGQIRTLGESLLARRAGDEVPEGGYQGEYVTDLAAEYDGPDDVTEAGRWAADRILERHPGHPRPRSASSSTSGTARPPSRRAAPSTRPSPCWPSKGLVFEQDGAIWFRATELGDTRDRVLRKSNGDATYLAGDLAYHRDKFLVRGFDRVIDVFGADHHGQVASLMAGVKALGVDPGRLEVKLGQMVSLVDGDEAGQDGQAGRQRHRPRHRWSPTSAPTPPASSAS